MSRSSPLCHEQTTSAVVAVVVVPPPLVSWAAFFSSALPLEYFPAGVVVGVIFVKDGGDDIIVGVVCPSLAADEAFEFSSICWHQKEIKRDFNQIFLQNPNISTNIS